MPWRKTKNPYRILVSEVMLQQTQVDRVIPYYRAFLKRFPTADVLAEAPLSEVLRAWQGLGYNRRAKALHDAAKQITTIYRSKFPREYIELVKLPGVGEYTAKAVRVFAYNEPEVLIETNVRAVFIHHFFWRSRSVPDTKLLPLVEASVRCSDIAQRSAREWYAALMDYGSYLKKTHGNASRKSAHHVWHKPFRGSDREIRGAILRAAIGSPLSRTVLATLPFNKKRTIVQLRALVREGLLIKTNHHYHLPS